MALATYTGADSPLIFLDMNTTYDLNSLGLPFWVYENPVFSWPENVEVNDAEVYKKEVTTSNQPKSWRHNLFKKLSIFFVVIGLILLVFSYGPSVWYSLRGVSSSALTNHGIPSAKAQSSYQPEFDRNLPLENSIFIPSIGVKSQIFESSRDNHEDALRKGVWRVNYFGTPYSREMPTILTAHRFGYLDWSLYFRLHNSFYKLPELKEGDLVEVVWRQRKYTYAIYKSEEGTEITDYGSDLILYTCMDLNSDVRVFKYAKLLEI